MTDDERVCLNGIIERYLAAGSPSHLDWVFDHGLVTESHRNLEAAGIVQRVFGTEQGFGWRLTATGRAQTQLPA